MDATAQLTKNIEEDHNSLIGLFKFAVSAIALPGNAQPISVKLVKGANRDAEILEDVCVSLEKSTSKVSSTQIRSELQRAEASLRHLLEQAIERFETPEGLGLVQSKSELRDGTFVLRRGSLDTTSFANALYHLGTPAGDFALKAGYLLREHDDDELLKKWLGNVSIET